MIKQLAAALCTMVLFGSIAQVNSKIVDIKKEHVIKPKVISHVKQTSYQIQQIMSKNSMKDVVTINPKTKVIKPKPGFKIYELKGKKDVVFYVITNESTSEEDLSIFAEKEEVINGITYKVTCLCAQGGDDGCTPSITSMSDGRHVQMTCLGGNDDCTCQATTEVFVPKKEAVEKL